MTDEEIIQKAINYAVNTYGEYIPHSDNSELNVCHSISIQSYIAGAHSQDEVIKELKEILSTRKAEIEDMEFMMNKLQREKDLLSSAYKLLEHKLNKLDPEWMTK